MIGEKIYRFDKLDSTNNYASKIAYESPEGTIVIAEKQVKGRGTQGKTWFSPEGGIWMSVVLKPKNNSCISLMAGVAVCEALCEIGVPAIIKWPNDILVNGKKIAGILTEALGKGDVIIGLGINLNVKKFPAELRNIATSVMIEKKEIYDKSKFIGLLINKLEEKYILLKEDKGKILEKWRSYSNIIQKIVKINSLGKLIQGKVIDIDNDGALLIELLNGNIKKITAGEYSIA